MNKRILSLLMAGVLVFSPSISAFAQEAENENEEICAKAAQEEAEEGQELTEVEVSEEESEVSESEETEVTKEVHVKDEIKTPVKNETAAEDAAAEVTYIENDETGIPDTDLYEAVLKAAGITDGKLTAAAAASITKLDASWRGIKNLQGIEYLEKLEFIDVSYNYELGSIDLLAGIDSLEYIDAGDCALTEVGAIQNLPNLKTLWLDDNKLESLAGIEKLTGLTTLAVNDNKLKDISEIKNLKHLDNNRLFVAGNKLTMWELLTQVPEKFSKDSHWLSEMWRDNDVTQLATNDVDVIIEAQRDVLPAGTSGQVSQISYKGANAQNNNIFGKEITKYELVKVEINNQMNGKATFHLDIPEEYDRDNLGVLAVDEDGSYTKLDYVSYREYLAGQAERAVFQADNSTCYAVVEFAANTSGNAGGNDGDSNDNTNSTDEPGNRTSNGAGNTKQKTTSFVKSASAPKTGDASAFGWQIAFMLLSVGAVAVIVTDKRRKNV